jgi:hypothetical protein
MKPNSEKDFWTYEKMGGHIVLIYCIDGSRMGKYSSVQYLMETYGMSDSEAFHYVNDIVRHI